MSKLRALWQREVNEHAKRYIRSMDAAGAGEHAINESIAAGADIEAVAEALGHKDPPGTIVLVDPRFVSYFEKGINLLDLPEAEARAMLGNEVYEVFMDAKAASIPRGTLTVTAIDGKRRPSRT
jgi:hypothetical protein